MQYLGHGRIATATTRVIQSQYVIKFARHAEGPSMNDVRTEVAWPKSRLSLGRLHEFSTVDQSHMRKTGISKISNVCRRHIWTATKVGTARRSPCWSPNTRPRLNCPWRRNGLSPLPVLPLPPPRCVKQGRYPSRSHNRPPPIHPPSLSSPSSLPSLHKQGSSAPSLEHAGETIRGSSW